MPGHSVLQLPVPALEEWVRARTAHYDAGFVSTDPRFGHAHVTALGPFDPAPSDLALATIADLAAATAPIPVRLAELAQFPNGIIHLVPDPDHRLRDLTARLVAAFPDWLPYGGEFGDDVQPHLTVDAASDEVDLDSTAAPAGRRGAGGLRARPAAARVVGVGGLPRAARVATRLMRSGLADSWKCPARARRTGQASGHAPSRPARPRRSAAARRPEDGGRHGAARPR